MDEQLNNSDTKLNGDQRIAENSLDVAYRRNLQTDGVDFMSQVVEKITGYSVREMTEMGSISKSSDLIHPDDLPLVTAGFAHAIDVGFGTLEYRFKHKDGKYRWFADHFMIVRDQDGEPLFSEGIMRDITWIKK